MKLTRNAKAVLNSSKGFTLFEILIVIAILGGLMAVVIQKVIESQKRAAVGTTKMTMNQLIQNLTMYQNDCQKYPASLDALAKADDCKNWTGPYTKNIPKDSWNTPFIYESDGNTFKLKSLGADKKEGGDGLNKDIDSDDL